ncbi:MAG: hypothetical protein LBU18_06890 [Treponema sp.]|jgi:hypothetical protein|nr:hypothetical protein [Treponema sp.]
MISLNSQKLMAGETINLYGRPDPNPASTESNKPLNSTALIGKAVYCDGSAAHSYPEDAPSGANPSTPGYYVRASAYYDTTSFSIEVK